MHSFSIRKEYNAQKLPVHLFNWCPAPNSSILLNGFLDRMIDYALNPLVVDNSAVWSPTGRVEIGSALHLAILYGERLLEKHYNCATAKKSPVSYTHLTLPTNREV